MTDVTVRRVDFGWFIRPAEETGTGAPRVEPTLGYLIDHPAGRVLVDTGMGGHPEVDAHYRPHRVPLAAALAAAGASIGDIRLVVNCHLHFDHSGGNPQFAGVPLLTQRIELATARTVPFHTLPELVDFPGARYEELDGAAEILPGVRIVPTPGHTAGHQSVVVTTADGTVIVAGQSHDHATAFTGDVLAHRADRILADETGEANKGVGGAGRTDGARRAGVGEPPPWVAELLALDPRRVLFAHDNAVWTP